MRNLHSFYEVLKTTIEVIFFAVLLMGITNILINPVFGVDDVVKNEYVLNFIRVIYRTAQFMVINFPFLMLIRLSARRGGSGTSLVAAIAGYAAYLISTMMFASQSMPSGAFSSILGISYSTGGADSVMRYPIQTGLVGAAIVAFITLGSFNRSRNRNEYGFFSFVSKESTVTLRTILFSSIAGFGIALVWPHVLAGIQKIVSFITADTTNPINLALYGITDRFLGTLNLGTLIRQPFWYGVNGGSWVNLAGSPVTGDAVIWTSQLSANALTGVAGRFFTPYYVLNIFAVPGMIWGMFSLSTDAMDRRKKRIFCLLATIASLVSGTLLPLELMLLLLCPLLYCFHLAYTGVLYAVLHTMHVYLGYQTAETLTLSALPGTLPEFLTYLRYPSLLPALTRICIVGVISMVIYFMAVRICFRYLALDLFNTGDKERAVGATLAAFGGTENIKMIQSNLSQLTINVYDPEKINLSKLRKLGSIRVFETRAGYTLCFGASSTMIRKGINEVMRKAIRNVE